MTQWAQKVVQTADWQSEQDRFQELFSALKEPEEMMLVAAAGPNPQSASYIIELPDDIPLDRFDGFAKISEHSLPDEASLLIGYEDRFQTLFSFGPEEISPRQ